MHRTKREAPDTYTDMSLYDRCITLGLPNSMMPMIYGNAYGITQSPGYVAIRYEMVHETRVIPLDGSPHPSPALGFLMGDARGRWEGDTLVVETTNIREPAAYRNASAALKITERFTPIDESTLSWQVRFDDPATWTAPWSFEMPLSVLEPVIQSTMPDTNVLMPSVTMRLSICTSTTNSPFSTPTSISRLDWSAYSVFDRQNGVRRPPMTATRRKV